MSQTVGSSELKLNRLPKTKKPKQQQKYKLLRISLFQVIGPEMSDLRIFAVEINFKGLVSVEKKKNVIILSEVCKASVSPSGQLSFPF